MNIESIGTIYDDCPEATTFIDVDVIKSKDGNNIIFKPLVRLEMSCQGSSNIQFDIKTLDTGFKLMYLIAKAMKEAKVKGMEE